MGDLVFISHSNRDKAVADAICAELERAGIRCWIAPRDITPGRRWGEAIIDGIDASRVMIVVHSRHANKSHQVMNEVERAVNRRLLLLQVRLADIKPSRALELFIASSQWLNAFPGPIDAYLKSLPELVENLLAQATDTGEITAERTAERTAAAQGAEHHAEPALLRPTTPTVQGNEFPAHTPSAPPAAPGQRPSWLIPSVVASVAALGFIGTWALTQMNRDNGAPTVAANPQPSSTVDSTANATGKPPGVVSDSVVPVLRITSTVTTYRVDDRFSLRVEWTGDLPLKFRSGNRRVVALAPGDSVFRAVESGTAYLYAESGPLRDSVRVQVAPKVVVVNTKPPSPVSPVTVPNANAAKRETTTASSGNASGKDVPRPPALTDALAASKASACMQAVERHDATWIRAHYGSPLTIGDAANLKTLESMFGRSKFKAALLVEPKFVGNAVHFSMRIDYPGGFGPRLSVDVPFEVRMANDQPHGEPATCRARVTLKAP